MRKPVKQLEIKLFIPGHEPAKSRLRAPNGRCFTSKGVDALLAQVADRLESTYPNDEFRMVVVGRGAYNFVHAGAKTAA